MFALAEFKVVVCGYRKLLLLSPSSLLNKLAVSTDIGFTTSDEETTEDSFLIFHCGSIPME